MKIPKKESHFDVDIYVQVTCNKCSDSTNITEYNWTKALQATEEAIRNHKCKINAESEW